MSSSTTDTHVATATSLTSDDDSLTVELTDGRTLSIPLAWYPRLSHGTAEERGNWRMIGGGTGIHWSDLDEDISIENLLAGKASGESQPSLKKWLEKRSDGDIT
jgi:hypothetical protein